MALFRRKQDAESPLSHVIDLTNQPAPSGPRLVWGMPSTCPNCNDFGYLDHIDLINEVSDALFGGSSASEADAGSGPAA